MFRMIHHPSSGVSRLYVSDMVQLFTVIAIGIQIELDKIYKILQEGYYDDI